MKDGVKTTEFWVAVAVILFAALGALLQVLPYEWAATAASVVAAIWVVARTVLKLSGKGLIVDEAEKVRQTVREEIAFALADKEKAKPVVPGERGSVQLATLAVVTLAFLSIGVLAFLPKAEGGSARVESLEEVVPEVRPSQAQDWLVYVPVQDTRPFLVRLFSSITARPTFVIVRTEDGHMAARISRIELTGRAEW